MTQRLTLLLVFLFSIPIVAQQSTGTTSSERPDTATLLQKIRDLEDRVIALEGQIRQLKGQPAAPAAAPAQPGGTPESGTPSVAAAPQGQQVPTSGTVPSAPEGVIQSVALGGAGGSAAKALNPDMSMIGDFIGS